MGAWEIEIHSVSGLISQWKISGGTAAASETGELSEKSVRDVDRVDILSFLLPGIRLRNQGMRCQECLDLSNFVFSVSFVRNF